MHPGHRLRLAANVLNGSTLAGIVVASACGARLRPAGDGLRPAPVTSCRYPGPPRSAWGTSW